MSDVVFRYDCRLEVAGGVVSGMVVVDHFGVDVRVKYCVVLEL